MKWLCDYTKQDQRGFREVLDPNAKEEYKHTGIHLMAADGYILENYDINISSDDSIKNKIACQDVYIKLLGKPEDISAIIIDSQTNIAFEDGLVLAVKGPITLGKCKNLKIKSHDFGREATLEGGLFLRGVTDSIIRFAEPRAETLKSIKNGLVSFDTINKLDISIPENVKKAKFYNNFNITMAIPKEGTLNRIKISAFDILMNSCSYDFKSQYGSLNISADVVKCESNTFSSKYINGIEVNSTKEGERSEFKANGADFCFEANGVIKAYTPTLIFDRMKNGPTMPVRVTNSAILVSPLIFFCSDALTLSNSTVTCNNGGVNFGKAIIENSTVELSATPGKQNAFIIAEIHESSVKNFTGDLKGVLNDVTINNLTMEENTSIKIEPPQRVFGENATRVSYTFCNISGVTIKKDSSLNVSGNASEYLNKEYDFSPVSITNSIVEGGATYIYGDALLEANNSVFKNVKLGITNGYQYATHFDSAVLSGKVDLASVKEVAFSDLNESAISGGIAPITVRDQSIDNQNITDYGSYLAIKEAQINPNASTKITNEIEVL